MQNVLKPYTTISHFDASCLRLSININMTNNMLKAKKLIGYIKECNCTSLCKVNSHLFKVLSSHLMKDILESAFFTRFDLSRTRAASLLILFGHIMSWSMSCLF